MNPGYPHKLDIHSAHLVLEMDLVQDSQAPQMVDVQDCKDSEQHWMSRIPKRCK